jgi:hypothetical protein
VKVASPPIPQVTIPVPVAALAGLADAGPAEMTTRPSGNATTVTAVRSLRMRIVPSLVDVSNLQGSRKRTRLRIGKPDGKFGIWIVRTVPSFGMGPKPGCPS